jgi:hypothetical protein
MIIGYASVLTTEQILDLRHGELKPGKETRESGGVTPR